MPTARRGTARVRSPLTTDSVQHRDQLRELLGQSCRSGKGLVKGTLSAEGASESLADVFYIQYQAFIGSILGLYTGIILNILVLHFCFGHG